MTSRPCLSTHPPNVDWRKPSTARLALLETRSRLAGIESGTINDVCRSLSAQNDKGLYPIERSAKEALRDALRSFLATGD